MLSATVGDLLDPLKRPGRRKPPVAPATRNIGEQLLAYCATAAIVVFFGRNVPNESILLMAGVFLAAVAEMRGIRVASPSPRPAGLPFAFLIVPALCVAKISLYPGYPHVASAATLYSSYWRLMLDLALACGHIAVTSCFFKEAPLYGGGWLACIANIGLWVTALTRLRPEVDSVLVAAPLAVFYLLFGALSHLLSRSFSLGEALLLAQGVTLYTAELVLTLAGLYWPQRHLAFYLQRTPRPTEDLFLQCLFVATVGAAAVLIVGRHRKSLFWPAAALASFAATFVLWARIVGLPLLWLWYTHFSQTTQLLLSLYWAGVLLVTLSVLAMLHHVSPTLRLDFGARKLFHLVALALFIPASWLSPSYLRLAQAGACAVMLLTELTLGSRRFAHSAARRFLLHFRDEQDDPELLLTHIYLLVGCALPLWLESQPDGRLVRVYAGLLVLGIGDAAASLVGRAIGRLRWPRRRRTVEGSIAATLAPMGVLYAASLLTDSPWEALTWKRVATACGAAALLEALSSHVDNLVLTPVFYTLMLALAPQLSISADAFSGHNFE